ncbi:YcbK family protein [Ramlibacter sp. AN1133]|uniref:YcbK family protein n=1 Tax=Ramlibacter sp. AN1133 TaxID=3133429 RepID=UPI0030C4431F
MTDRRHVLVAGFALLASGVRRPSWAAGSAGRFADDFWKRPRRIMLQQAKSGERIESTYWSDGELLMPEYTQLSYFMRDRVTGTGVYVHPVLLDILYGINGWLAYYGVRSPVILTSAYRDPRRNLAIEGSVRNSLHTHGDAADIVIPGVNALQVARFGMWLGGGGVGWYPGKQFTHVDRGRLRSWRG